MQTIKAKALKFYPEKPASEDVQRELLNLWLSNRKFIILSGPPGVGKTRAAEDFVEQILNQNNAKFGKEDCRITKLFPDFRTKVYSDADIKNILTEKNLTFVWDLCVLHPQYAYEDLIRGYRMSESENNKLEVREGILGFISRVVYLIKSSAESENLPLGLLIMDEINRAPIGQLFGEAFYAIDRRGMFAPTPYDLKDVGSSIVIPDKLLLLGTMNSVDRAVSGFDFALRRRFVTVNISTSEKPIRERFKSLNAVGDFALRLYNNVNNSIKTAKKTGVVPVTELVIGHSYFLPPESLKENDDIVSWLAQSYLYQILPTLLDYQEQGLIEFNFGENFALPYKDILSGQRSLSEVTTQEIAKHFNSQITKTGENAGNETQV